MKLKYLSDTSHPLYAKWRHIKERCENPNHKKAAAYGGRGISVCPEWADYDNFFMWAIYNGWQPGLQIDRKDVDGDYEPSNCRFVTNQKNCRNKRNNLSFTHNGETRCLKEWCEILKLNYGTTHMRIVRGWSFNDAICVPVLSSMRRCV